MHSQVENNNKNCHKVFHEMGHLVSCLIWRMTDMINDVTNIVLWYVLYLFFLKTLNCMSSVCVGACVHVLLLLLF